MRTVGTIRILSAAVLAVAASAAFGQVRQIQLGNPMDANPGVGAGGSNAPVQGFVPVNGNEIMTGNVTGLGYFHGAQQQIAPGVFRSSIGTFNPYQFNGNLGSNSLSNFARQSAGSSPTGAAYTGGSQAYYLPSATVSTGQGSLYSAPIGSGFDSSLVPRTSLNPGAAAAQTGGINPNSFAAGQAINRQVTGQPLEPGAPGTLLSTSLFVLRSTETPTARRVIGIQSQLPTTRPGLEPGATDVEKPTPGQLTGNINAVRNAQLVGQNDRIKEAQISDTYSKLASELQTFSGPTTTDLTREKPILGMPGGVETAQDLDPFTGNPRQITTLRGSAPPAYGTATTKPGATTKKAEPALAAGRLKDVPTTQLASGGKVKPVHLAPMTITGGASISAYDMTMTKAEQNLKLGKYLDAAETYQAALALKPEDPLALIGRAHAEFGAGLYSSAAHDLKFVFIRKPEMVSVHYDVGSFIPAARQEFLMEDLQKLTAKKETADMASFLFAYLCYQTGRNTAMQSELRSWGERPDRDDWQYVLNRAWVIAQKEEPK